MMKWVANLITDAIARRFTGEITFVYDAGRIVDVKRSTQLGPCSTSDEAGCQPPS